tara:strand:+ start:1940 stop:2167 length:228 start_codon:yes stop_codon:yes gene_type:complete
MKAYKSHRDNKSSCYTDLMGTKEIYPFGIGLFSMGLHINSQVFRFFFYPESQAQSLSSVHCFQQQTQMDCWQPIH